MYTKMKNNSLYSNLMGSNVISVSQLAGIYHKGFINYTQHQKWSKGWGLTVTLDLALFPSADFI